MRLDLAWWLWGRDRWRPPTLGGLAVLAVVALLFLIPLLPCPCGSTRPDFASLTAEELAAWAGSRCRACDGDGRVTPFHRLWFGKPRAGAEDSALPAPSP